MEDDYTVEPYIRVAAGDYLDLCDKWGKDSALTAILLTIGHELTHYFQWINALELTPIGWSVRQQICKICVRRLCRNKGASLSEDRMKKERKMSGRVEHSLKRMPSILLF